MSNSINQKNSLAMKMRLVVCVLAVTLCIFSGCSQTKDANPGTEFADQENGDVWIYPAGPAYADEDMGVTVTFPEEYWSSVLLVKPDDSILNIYYREVKEEEPLLTNGAILATIIAVDKSDESGDSWAKAAGAEFFTETETRNYYVSIQASDIQSDVSDKDMLEKLSTFVEENTNEVFTVILND